MLQDMLNAKCVRFRFLMASNFEEQVLYSPNFLALVLYKVMTHILINSICLMIMSILLCVSVCVLCMHVAVFVFQLMHKYDLWQYTN